MSLNESWAIVVSVMVGSVVGIVYWKIIVVLVLKTLVSCHLPSLSPLPFFFLPPEIFLSRGCGERRITKLYANDWGREGRGGGRE